MSLRPWRRIQISSWTHCAPTEAWLIQADILNLPIVRPIPRDATTALGAAYAAGLAGGYFKDVADLRANWAVEHTWRPEMSDEERERIHKLWKRAVTKSFDGMD